MELGAAPDCVRENLRPCSPEPWHPCDRCHRLICDIHDCLFEVWHQATGDYGGCDVLCQPCVETAYSRGEISQGVRWEYINHIINHR